MKGYLSDKEYVEIFNKVPRTCVDIIVIDGGGVLLVKRDTEPFVGMWSIPGGRILLNETIANAVNRISKRELGVGANIIESVGYMEFIKEHSVSIVVLCSLDSDATKGQFFYELPENIHPDHKEWLKSKKIL